MSMHKKSLVIYGCGGHARSLADIALDNGIEKLVFVDDHARENEKQFGFDVVKSIPLNEVTECILALGDNNQRAALFDSLKDSNIISLISSHAHIGKNAEIARGVFIGNGAHIGPNARIGDNTIINTHAVVEHDCVIGKHCHISVNAVVAGRSTVGDFVMVGAGATVIDGVKIGSHITIGAGAVVIDDILAPGTYVGVPARKTAD